ncbi:MAG: YbjN domain-containing protein [Treponema sp.]|jgi:hypothetical protein|nr:YbjN domain-containing protein [Treponema sp.]
MKKKALLFFVTLVVVCAGSLNAQMSKSQLQQMYVSYLTEQGYQPSIDSDGDIIFKVEGGTYYIAVDEDDLQSFRIVFPNFWEIESPSEKVQVRDVANYINRTTKVVKLWLNSREDNVSMEVNIFIGKPEDFKLHFRRIINLLLAERREFLEKMNE